MIRLSTATAAFSTAFAALLAQARETTETVGRCRDHRRCPLPRRRSAHPTHRSLRVPMTALHFSAFSCGGSRDPPNSRSTSSNSCRSKAGSGGVTFAPFRRDDKGIKANINWQLARAGKPPRKI
jgi:hypothetical protein